MLKDLIFLICTACAADTLIAQEPAWQPTRGHTETPIWPTGVPDAKPARAPEVDTTTSKDAVIAGKAVVRLGNVASPTITLYSPKDKNTGAAVIVFPGGGYRILAIDLEGTEVCDWLTSTGITCVVLKYRVPDSGPYPKSPAALQDAQRAFGLVRSHAVEWHLDPHRIGVLGFSAGGHLAAALSTHFNQRLYQPIDAADQLSCRPDFAVIVYPGYLALSEQNIAPNPEIHVTKETPPTFLLQTEDDRVAHVESSLVYYAALKSANVPVEMHLYTEGGHGYGLRRTVKGSPDPRNRGLAICEPRVCERLFEAFLRSKRQPSSACPFDNARSSPALRHASGRGQAAEFRAATTAATHSHAFPVAASEICKQQHS